MITSSIVANITCGGSASSAKALSHKPLVASAPMARTWLEIRVDLPSGRGEDLDPSPGMIFICGASHSFGQLADTIDQAFGRWDLSHLHDFRLADGRRIGFPSDDDCGGDPLEDRDQLKPAKELSLGEEFTVTFTFHGLLQPGGATT